MPSEKTAISRKTISAPLQWLLKHGYVARGIDGLDYGCGHGFDAKYMGFFPYDSHWFPVRPEPGRVFDVVTCMYVLNVNLPHEIDSILQDLISYVAPGGRLYIAVRRDIKKEGVTSKGYQYNVVLDYPFQKLVENSSFVIYAWENL